MLDFKVSPVRKDDFLQLLQANLGIEEAEKAENLLRCTFKLIRSHLSFEESIKLIDHLPKYVKNLYVDGWKIQARKTTTLEGLMDSVADEGDTSHLLCFTCKSEAVSCIRIILETIEEYSKISDVKPSQSPVDFDINALNRKFPSVSLDQGF